MRINFALWSTNKYGGTRTIFEVANRLARRGHEVTITALSGDHRWFRLEVPLNYVKIPKWLKVFEPYTELKYRRSVQYLDVPSLFTKLDKTFDSSSALIKPLAEAIPDCDVNVATFYLTSPAVYRSRKGEKFYYIQGFDPLFFKNSYDALMANETYFLPLRKLVTSQWLSELIESISGDHCSYVGNGVNAETFYPKPVKTKNSSNKTVMSIFRYEKFKGGREVIESMNLLAKKIHNITLLGVGNERAFKELIRDKEINFEVTFIEPKDDKVLSELYSSADVFVFASWYEGFGLPPLEAMACGTPVVTTNCLGVKEYAIDQYNALLTPIRNPVALSNAMEKILTDENRANELRKNGLETANQHSWEKVVDRVEIAFKSFT